MKNLKSNIALIIISGVFLACGVVPSFRDNAGLIAPVAINAIVLLSNRRNNDKDDDDDKRHR
ncbi:hypothetical protein H6G41_30435 [Tolypothrix sp. FACHB-123]|uniref:hypothetical protein n=1 Tax=Tolypothrix sp. FACHB-123 TaxID=2692868 RepID=UPI0016856019|nr:hypothetical protein [Tolypothrix sp. FACHB-123]MBD2358866.1 hypothetical protein [Tolypothrix sp. FACHB-123]